MSCILSKFYIKPQHFPGTSNRHDVVSYRNSTSNHNTSSSVITPSALYLIEILHQTTTGRRTSQIDRPLYLIEILHQTTTLPSASRSMASLYLIEILHQTTTAAEEQAEPQRCILSKFYIKPQLIRATRKKWLRCILSKFYIKPQHDLMNADTETRCILSKFYIKPQPSKTSLGYRRVVSYRNSTSNHNQARRNWKYKKLYLIEILHQTTTSGLILIDKVLLTGCLPL